MSEHVVEIVREGFASSDRVFWLDGGGARDWSGRRSLVGVLADDESDGKGLQGNLTPLWVVKYTAFVKDRGVIENKGYFAGAELHEER